MRAQRINFPASEGQALAARLGSPTKRRARLQAGLLRLRRYLADLLCGRFTAKAR
jgi:hypothetical protein